MTSTRGKRKVETTCVTSGVTRSISIDFSGAERAQRTRRYANLISAKFRIPFKQRFERGAHALLRFLPSFSHLQLLHLCTTKQFSGRFIALHLVSIPSNHAATSAVGNPDKGKPPPPAFNLDNAIQLTGVSSTAISRAKIYINRLEKPVFSDPLTVATRRIV